MTERNETIVELIERSSLGAPAARKLRARTTADQRVLIIYKAEARSASLDSERGIPEGR